MCGRFLNSLLPAEVARFFGSRNPPPNYPARFNIAPTQPVLTVRLNLETKERSLDVLRWGLVPHWVKDLKIRRLLHQCSSGGACDDAGISEMRLKHAAASFRRRLL